MSQIIKEAGNDRPLERIEMFAAQSKLILIRGSFGVRVLVVQHCLAGKLNLIAFFADALDHYLLAFFQFIANIANATISDFRNVKEPVSTRKDFDKRAEVYDAANSANICLADLSFGS